MSERDIPDPASLRPIDIANLADEVIAHTNTWLTRDRRIAPIVLLDEPIESEQSQLRREDEQRRESARVELTRVGKTVAAAVAHVVADLRPLLELLDCAEREDQIGGMSARMGATLLLQQAVLRCQSKQAVQQSRDPSVNESTAIRAECLRTFDNLIAAIEDGKPGRELDVVRPLVFKIEEAVRRLGFDRVPIRFITEERSGLLVQTFELSYPWGGLQSVLLSRCRLGGKPGRQIRENLDTLENLISPENREEILRVLRAWRRELTPEAQPVTASLESTASPGKQRTWTQAAVDDAIRQYAKSVDRRLRDLERAVEKRTTGAVKEARKLFGRNAVMKKLGCSAGLVSGSTAWRAIAARLELLGNTPGIGRSDRVGIDRASDEQSHSDWKHLEADQRQDDASDQPRRRRRPGA